MGTERFVFDWWPGGLMWLFVFELVVLATMAMFRIVAKLLGRDEPHDFFVVFYRTFWQALRHPRLHPVPVNYEPVPPKRDEGPAISTSGEAIDEDALDSLFQSEQAYDDAPAAAGGAAVASADAGLDNELEVTCHGPCDHDGIRAIGPEGIHLAVKCDPGSGLANPVALREVALALGIPQHLLAIVSGQTRSQKTLRVNGVSPAELNQRLASASRDVPEMPASPEDDEEDGWGDCGDSVAFRDD